MTNAVLLAQQADYWVAGILTITAAVIVTVVILVSSRSGSGPTDDL